MSGLERILSTLHGAVNKPTPMMLHGFMPAAHESGFTMEEYRSSAKNIATSHLAFARKYGLDGVLVDVDTCMEAGAIGVPVDLPQDEPARTTMGLSDDIDRCIDASRLDGRGLGVCIE